MIRFAGFFTDAVAISIATAVSYLVAYRYEQAYLAFYGIHEQFITLSLELVALVFSSIVAFVASAYQIFSGISPWLSPRVRWWIYCFHVEFIVVVLGILLYAIIGFNWGTALSFLFVIALLINHLVNILRNVLNKRPVVEWFERWTSPPKQSSLRDLDDVLIEKLGFGSWALVVAVIVVLPNLGGAAGLLKATYQKSYSYYPLASSEAVLVGVKNDNFVFAEVTNGRATGKMLLKSVDAQSPLELKNKVYLNGIIGVGGRVYRATFSEWFSSVLGFARRERE